MKEFYKAIRYFHLFLRSKYFIFPVILFVILSLPRIIYDFTYTVNPVYTLVREHYTVKIDNLDSQTYFKYAKYDTNYEPKQYETITTEQNVFDIVKYGKAGIYRIDTTNNSKAIVSSIQALLQVYELETGTFERRDSKVKVQFIYNDYEVFIVVKEK